MNEKVVVFIINSTSGGGAEVSAMKIYRQLLSEGYAIKVIAVNQNVFLNGKESDSVIELNRTWKSGLQDTITSLISFQKIIKELNPEVVVAHCELPELFCAFMPNFRSKLFAVEHTSNPWVGRRTLGKIVRGILKLRRTKWITVNKSQSKIWFGALNPIYIANPVAKNQIFEHPRISEKVAFIGRVREEKRPEWAINAAIENSLPIAIIGDGEIRPSLSIRYANYKNLVNFYGFIENPWARLLPETLIVMPSKFEGDGLVAVEALINGFPIVLADNEDLRRFGLPSENYFANESELAEVFRQFKEQGVNALKIPVAKILEIQTERDIRTIATKWVQELNLEEHHL